ncbi:hypothetical protein [Geobacter grbiciae]|uniref:hypothetical protein n=1 Tax=Geobacter grbiciae TaxID=155042 RepID=UPI001FE3B83F|nr:hypothetical protein [Geobacter grbiciae]
MRRDHAQHCSNLDDVTASLRRRVGDHDARVVTYYRPGGYKGSIDSFTLSYQGTAPRPRLLTSLL